MRRAEVASPTEPTLDAIGHLLEELQRIDLILQLRAPRVTHEPAGEESGAHESSSVTLAAHSERLNALVHATLASGARLPLVDLCRNLELDEVSLGILMLAIAPHADRRFGERYAHLQGDTGVAAPQIDLALDLFAGSPAERLALRDRFAPNSPLLRCGFIKLVEPADRPYASELAQVIMASPRILRFLTASGGAEPEVEALRASDPLPPPTAALTEALGRLGVVCRLGQRPAPIAIVQSEDPGAVLGAAAVLADSLGLPLLAIDLGRPPHGRPIEQSIRALFDEARLLGALLALSGFDALDDRARDASLAATAAELERFDGPCVVALRAAADLRYQPRRRSLLTFDVPLPEAGERLELWRAQLAPRSDGETSLTEVAHAFRLGSAQIRDAARMVETLDAADGPRPEHLRIASRALSHHGLGELAQRVAPWGVWDDLILPPSSLGQLRGLVAQLHHRDQVFRGWGLGKKVAVWRRVAALFGGPPGTGKTLAASLVAQALGLDLFRIDLAGVVSKYIGETEKNLDRVFRAAHRSNAVLFFDEADALFGKRTEVKDAHDRYANVETSYLLQRLENFEGLAILATNLRKNIDVAFLRRVDVLIDFPFPTKESRLRLWQSLFPAEMPRDADLDLVFLADQFELAGGHIKNAIQAGALLAAADGASVGMTHLLAGVRDELNKLGKITTASDFGPYADPLVKPPSARGRSSTLPHRPRTRLR